ncbi:hypothetical protein AB0C34_06235 [Nocardia sp. NPDC049220]|uniref:hypothetical protein n=1 Tax=Nocardia sp. NPDC049220 TaxID=3155273 RepID=UPI0033F6CBE7
MDRLLAAGLVDAQPQICVLRELKTEQTPGKRFGNVVRRVRFDSDYSRIGFAALASYLCDVTRISAL